MIQERLYKMIDYAKGRYDWYEEQREKRVTMALGMIALSGVAMTVIIGATKPGGIDAKSTAFLASGAVLLTVFLTAFSVFLTYLRGQNLNYTHRKELTTIYSWYHYGVPKDTDVCLLEHLIFGKYSTSLIGRNTNFTVNKKRKTLSNGFGDFCSKVTQLWQDDLLRFDEDLQQVYVLQILQSISRDNLQRMNSILKVGILATGSAVVFLAVIILISGVPTLPASI